MYQWIKITQTHSLTIKRQFKKISLKIHKFRNYKNIFLNNPWIKEEITQVKIES